MLVLTLSLWLRVCVKVTVSLWLAEVEVLCVLDALVDAVFD